MVEEETKEEEPVIEEKEPNYLEQLKALTETAQTQIAELKELKSVEILSGKADAGAEPEKPEEETPEEYAQKALKGNIDEK